MDAGAKMSNAGRVQWIDSLKGVTIFLVIFAHVIDGFGRAEVGSGIALKMGNWIYKVIYIFHMPLFVAISGYVFSLAYLRIIDKQHECARINRKEQYRNQICNLTANYFMFSIMMFLFKLLFAKYVNQSVDWKDLIYLPVKSISLVPYWYFYVLIFLYLLTAFIMKQSWNKNTVILILWGIYIVYAISGLPEIVTIQRVINYACFFLFGCLYQIRGGGGLNKHYVLQGGIAVCGIAIVLFGDNVLPRFIICIIRICTASFLINILFGVAEKYWNHIGICSWIGKRSLEIFVLHLYITSGIRPVLRLFHIDNYLAAVVMTTFLGIVIPVGCSYVLKRAGLWNAFFKPVTYQKR